MITMPYGQLDKLAGNGGRHAFVPAGTMRDFTDGVWCTITVAGLARFWEGAFIGTVNVQPGGLVQTLNMRHPLA